MDKEEARQILEHQIEFFRDKSYDELALLVGSQKVYTQMGSSGVEYQIEVQAFWDHPRRPDKDLRVLISVDDGRFFSSFKPMTADFIMAPDGRFIGE